MTHYYNPREPDFAMSRRIEGASSGPDLGASNKAQDVLALYRESSKYDALRAAFGAKDDGSDPFDGWTGETVKEMLRGALGAAEDFSSEYDRMSDVEKAKAFSDHDVALIVEMWADHGREPRQ